MILEEGGIHPPLKDGSCLALSCLALSCLSLSCLALTCLVMLCLSIPCLALPCPALPEGKPTEAKDAMASLRNPKERPRDAQRRSKGGQGTMREAKRRPKALFEEILCTVPRYACFSQHATKSPQVMSKLQEHCPQAVDALRSRHETFRFLCRQLRHRCYVSQEWPNQQQV